MSGRDRPEQTGPGPHGCDLCGDRSVRSRDLRMGNGQRDSVSPAPAGYRLSSRRRSVD